MSVYDKLDQLIVEAIKSGCNTFAKIDAGEVRKEAQRLEREMPPGPTGRKPAFLYIDSLLQALRKRDWIENRKGSGWVLKNAS
jgi:hypothetical protein